MYADGGSPSRDIIFYQRIKRFGAWDALGRALYVREMIMITVIENIITAYNSRQSAENFASWAKQEQDLARILGEAEVLANV